MPPNPTSKEGREKMKRGVDDCLTDCVAYIFNIHTSRVPFFIGYENYGKELRKYFKKQGYKIEPWVFDESLFQPKRLYIVQGISPRFKRKRHAVVYRGNQPEYDPHWSAKFLKKPEHVWIATLLKINK